MALYRLTRTIFDGCILGPGTVVDRDPDKVGNDPTYELIVAPVAQVANGTIEPIELPEIPVVEMKSVEKEEPPAKEEPKEVEVKSEKD